MVATSLMSLVLLALAGVLLDSHRKEWRAAVGGDRAGSDFCFARSRHRRRTVATLAIALGGVLIALWPVTPRVPFWVVVYTATLVSLAGMIFLLGVADAWASGRYYRVKSRQRIAEHRETLTRLVNEHRSGNQRSGKDRDAGPPNTDGDVEASRA